MKEIKIPLQNEKITDGVEFIQKSLTELKFDNKKIVRCMLVAEELMVQMIENADEKSEITIRISGNKSNAKVNISSVGKEFKIDILKSVDEFSNLKDLDCEKTSVISNMILNAYSSFIKLNHSKGVNRATFSISKSNNSSSKLVILSLVLGIVCGILFKFLLPESVSTFASENVLSVISTLFLKSIKMVIAPLVFFSIADSMSGFSDYSTFGRISFKIIGMYIFTTVCALFISYGVFSLIKPGDSSLAPVIMKFVGSSSSQTVADISLKNTLIEIVPSNITEAFFKADLLQLIFVAVLIGVASSFVGRYSKSIQDFIHCGNLLFSQLTTMIIKTLPLAVFCLITDVIITIGFDSLLQLINSYLTSVASIAALMVAYMIFIVLFARLNPLKFIGKYKDACLMAISTCSSSATMPLSMKCCENLGISQKIYSFSIPLGTTINMDGLSVFLLSTTLFMARIFGIDINFNLLFSLFVSIILISIGCPGIPGAALACLALLFNQIGIPAEAVGFVAILSTLIDFFTTSSNVTGDAVVSTIIAKSENMLDVEKYNS